MAAKCKYLWAWLMVSVLAVGCDKIKDASRTYDDGLSDGYAVGYNTECKIRATLVYGAWENEDYTNGYNDGYLDGAADCRRDGGPNGWNK